MTDNEAITATQPEADSEVRRQLEYRLDQILGIFTRELFANTPKALALAEEYAAILKYLEENVNTGDNQ